MDQLKFKERCREVMLEHLISKGYPNLTRRQIVRELPELWKKLDAEGLTTVARGLGGDYDAFVNIVLQKAHEAEFEDQVVAMIDKMRRSN